MLGTARPTRYYAGTMEVHQIPGDRHSILKQPNVSIVAEAIEKHILN